VNRRMVMNDQKGRQTPAGDSEKTRNKKKGMNWSQREKRGNQACSIKKKNAKGKGSWWGERIAAEDRARRKGLRNVRKNNEKKASGPKSDLNVVMEQTEENLDGDEGEKPGIEWGWLRMMPGSSKKKSQRGGPTTEGSDVLKNREKMWVNFAAPAIGGCSRGKAPAFETCEKRVHATKKNSSREQSGMS